VKNNNKLPRSTAHSHGRWVRFGVASNESKIDMEKIARSSDEEIVQMPISNAENESDDAVTRTTSHERVDDFRVNSKRSRRHLVSLAQIVVNVVSVVVEDVGDCLTILDALHHSVARARGQDAVRFEAQVEILAF
jgi:hypothetical protein